MSIADKITRLQTAKDNIAAAITAQGGAVSEGDGFEEFANDIGTIQTGGDLESFIAGTSTSVTYEGEIVRDCAFAGMSDLEEVNLPNATYIGCDAFHNQNATSIVSESEGDIHFNNNNLTTVNIPKVTNILQGAFKYCDGLEHIDLSDTLIRIGAEAFAYSGLKEIEIPDSVIYINNRAFSYCSSLSTVIVGSNVSNFSFSDAFQDSTGIQNVTLGVNPKDNGGFYAFRGLHSVTLLEGVTSIGIFAFSSSLSLSQIALPSSVAIIKDQAFFNCTSLSIIDLTAFDSTDSIPVLETNSVFKDISSDAKFYFKDAATLDAFASAQYWSDLASHYTFTTDPVPTPSE